MIFHLQGWSPVHLDRFLNFEKQKLKVRFFNAPYTLQFETIQEMAKFFRNASGYLGKMFMIQKYSSHFKGLKESSHLSCAVKEITLVRLQTKHYGSSPLGTCSVDQDILCISLTADKYFILDALQWDLRSLICIFLS